jgi:hypothetical protein
MESTQPFAQPQRRFASANVVALRETYLRRLERIIRLRQRHYHELNEDGLRLLDRSIFAAYCDCRDAGMENDARKVLQEAQFPIDPQHDAA